ncbi:MAG TPA: pyruvate, phosphate dikinase [Streptosporangiaceae bacterium]
MPERSSFTIAFDDPADFDRETLGGKGFGLVEMTRSGLRVPPGYVIATTACHRYLRENALPAGLADEIFTRLAAVEQQTGKRFGGGPVPLLLSVRSGAPVSMPGMMDTILNLGLSREAAVALAESTGDTRFMADVLFRFHRMYAETVLGAVEVPEQSELDDVLAAVGGGAEPGAVYDQVWRFCQERVDGDVGERVPGDPRDQLIGAVEAVFRSWNTRRAVTYRDLHRIPHDLGTAVVVQSMVFGNLGDDSGSGVVFTRNPVTGEPALFGEFLAAGQGEDVVAGTHTPQPVAQLADTLPEVLEELRAVCRDLEAARNDVLDIEFTVEHGRLYLLQVRAAKRTAQAAIRIAADFLDEGLMSPSQALAVVTAEQVRQVQRPGFDPGDVAEARAEGRVLARGVGASPGQVSGRLALDAEQAEKLAKEGTSVILARRVTSPTDLHGMIAAAGILTATGGSTSHAAVVARALGTTCVVGCSGVTIDERARTVQAGETVLDEGDVVSLDGSTGEVFAGDLPSSEPAADDRRLAGLLRHASAASRTTVLAKVSTPEQVKRALARGATGVVVAIDDVLATAGKLADLVETLQGGDGRIDTGRLERIVTEQFTPILAACEGVEVGVRTLDVHADEAVELLRATQVFIEHPQLAMALGAPEIVQAQVRALATAARDAGSGAAVHVAVRSLSDPAEATALKALRDELPERDRLLVGSYVTSPRGALLAPGIAGPSDVLWLELRVVQAAMFGIAGRHLLTREPLESYVRRGLLGTDPREAIDASVTPLLDAVAHARRDHADCAVGIRLSGPVSEDVAAALHDRGFRRFAVDADEVRPSILALGKAAGPQH